MLRVSMNLEMADTVLHHVQEIRAKPISNMTFYVAYSTSIDFMKQNTK